MVQRPSGSPQGCPSKLSTPSGRRHPGKAPPGPDLPFRGARGSGIGLRSSRELLLGWREAGCLPVALRAARESGFRGALIDWRRHVFPHLPCPPLPSEPFRPKGECRSPSGAFPRWPPRRAMRPTGPRLRGDGGCHCEDRFRPGRRAPDRRQRHRHQRPSGGQARQAGHGPQACLSGQLTSGGRPGLPWPNRPNRACASSQGPTDPARAPSSPNSSPNGSAPS